MRLRLVSGLLIFLSAYSPLSIIFLIQDIDYTCKCLKNPEVVLPILSLSVVSCIVLYISVGKLKSSSPPIRVKSVTNRSGELINYSIPYMISFFVMDLGDKKLLLSFVFFMGIIFFLTLKTHNIFINPVLALMGYNIYDVKYVVDGNECQNFFLVKGARLKKGDICRIAEVSEQLHVVTDRSPKV